MNSLNDTEKKKLSRSLKETMIVCQFNSRQCSDQDFVWYFDPIYGNCWQFNADNNDTTLKSSNYPGLNFGLSIFFYVNFLHNLKTMYAYTGSVLGAIIRIENSSYLTNYQQDGIILDSGHSTTVAMSRSFKSILPSPYSNCRIDNQTNSGFHSELFDLIQNSQYRYSQSLISVDPNILLSLKLINIFLLSRDKVFFARDEILKDNPLFK